MISALHGDVDYIRRKVEFKKSDIANAKKQQNGIKRIIGFFKKMINREERTKLLEESNKSIDEIEEFLNNFIAKKEKTNFMEGYSTKNPTDEQVIESTAQSMKEETERAKIEENQL